MRATVSALTVLVLLGAVSGLSACSPKGSHGADFTDAVVGPDLGKAGPFAQAHEVLLDQPSPASGSSAPDAEPLMHIDIVPSPAGDSATLVHVVSDTKPYLAGGTYHAFLPIVAETNARQKDYWIVGLNLTRTPDRSIYTVLRFPHGQSFAPGTSSDTVEYLQLACGDLDMARSASYQASDDNGKPKGAPVTLDAAPPPEAGACEYNSLKEALAVTPAALRNYDRIRNVPDAPALEWRPLHMTVK